MLCDTSIMRRKSKFVSIFCISLTSILPALQFTLIDCFWSQDTYCIEEHHKTHNFCHVQDSLDGVCGDNEVIVENEDILEEASDKWSENVNMGNQINTCFIVRQCFECFQYFWVRHDSTSGECFSFSLLNGNADTGTADCANLCPVVCQFGKISGGPVPQVL